MIGARIAYLLYAVIAVFAWLNLKDNYRVFGLIIVFALAAKTYVEERRRKL